MHLFHVDVKNNGATKLPVVRRLIVYFSVNIREKCVQLSFVN